MNQIFFSSFKSFFFLMPLLQHVLSAAISTAVKSPLPSVSNPGNISFDIPTVAAAIIAMGVGLAFVFFGRKLFKFTIFVCGFIIFASFAAGILYAIHPDGEFGDSKVVFYVTCLVAGVIGGFLACFLWRMGLALAGGAIGYLVALLILSLKSDSLISNSTGRTAFIIFCVILFAIMVFFLERHLLILGTSFGGAFAFMNGVDVFANTGFRNNLASTGFDMFQEKYKVSPSVYAMILGVFLLGFVGAVVQYRVTSKRK